MAREEGGKAKPWGKKGFLSAVYVNRFGRHLSGTAIRFGHNAAKEQKLQERGVVCSPAGSTCPLNDPASLDVGLKSRRYKKKATFTPPKHTKQAESPLEQTHAGALTQNNENHDVFKFPLPANSNAAKSKDKKKKGLRESTERARAW
ncbi:hypothetical protein chiPu_0007996 [Chiloscyllium punctatum]|uniref:Uncharacterized protein n=1 Tax=Chiloscyllium punctatum TaxID=137246 RepID=A0A401SGP8_CHIPU|nr:hypothetical protein [Chiloscyllium punctatum]